MARPVISSETALGIDIRRVDEVDPGLAGMVDDRARIDARWSRPPNIIVPRQIGETLRPERPS